MKCPKCNGKGNALEYVAERNCNGEWEKVLREIPCDKCQRKPMTNEEWLRSCSTEELREFLFDVFGQGVMFGETHEKAPMFPDDEVVTVSVFDWWLKEKHE